MRCKALDRSLILSDLTMAIVFVLFLLSLAYAQSPVVNLGYSSYEGRSLSNGISQWLGMRFASPPVGWARFAAPQDPPVQEGVQRATSVCVGFSQLEAPLTNLIIAWCPLSAGGKQFEYSHPEGQVRGLSLH